MILGTHKMQNINLRGTHIFVSLFSMKLSLKWDQVEVYQTILKISYIALKLKISWVYPSFMPIKQTLIMVSN